VVPAELIPLSVLALDLPAPAEWSAYLADRVVQIVLDDLRGASISRTDARRLFTERREAEARSREMTAELERAIEQDWRFRAQLGHGVPASAIPHGMTYGQAVASAGVDGQAYRPRASVVKDLLSNDGSLTFHSLATPDGDES
jgi:hypothetical protein